jgi:hypothetical protein
MYFIELEIKIEVQADEAPRLPGSSASERKS